MKPHRNLFYVLYFVLIALSSLPVYAYNRQCVLLEGFTQWNCGPCASWNPQERYVLNAMTRDTVVSIKFHAWWPTVNDDAFYLWNAAENGQRINYYGVSFVPDGRVDGNTTMDRSTAWLYSTVRSRYNTTSPCMISMSALAETATTIHFQGSVTADADMSGSNYRLYVALITNLVTYGSPPGLNGETVFDDIMRDMWPNANAGQSFAINVGQTYAFDGTLNCDASWDYSNLSVVAFVQNSTTKEILQTKVIALPSGTITLTSPIGGETWYNGEVHNITWTSSSLFENIVILLNRNFPAGSWEAVSSETANTGSFAWNVSGSATGSARILVYGGLHTSVRDTSVGNFTIATRSITVTSPNGGEVWWVGDTHNITWTSQNISGLVNIAIDRHYSSGVWETIASNVPNSLTYSWLTSGSPSSYAVIRVSSVSYPTVNDISNSSFAISQNQPPAITHDPLCDQTLSSFTVTANVIDDSPSFIARIFYRLQGTGSYDSLVLSPTVNDEEYACTLGPLAQGKYEYFLRVLDSGGLSSVTPNYEFTVAESCGAVQAFDDGSAEVSHWAENENYQWAVKFSAGTNPYVLCGAQIGISAVYPTTQHTSISVRVMQANGANLPGTVVFEKTVGSIGNVIGGVPEDPASWALVHFRDEANHPLVMNGDFFISVQNPQTGKYESFLMDTSSARSGRSYVFDPCDSLWYNEDSGQPSSRPGNRMIRTVGFSLVSPSGVVIRRNGNDLHLNWNGTGAPFYLVYSSQVSGGSYNVFEGSSSTNSLTINNAFVNSSKFYCVVASATQTP